MDVKSNSPARGKSGLQMGDIINEINGCNVTSRSDWRACIIENINPKLNHNKVNIMLSGFMSVSEIKNIGYVIQCVI